MDLARFGAIKFFSTSEEQRPFNMTVTRSARIDTHTTLTGFVAAKPGVDARQVNMNGVWSLEQGSEISTRIEEFDAALESREYDALVVGSIMIGFFYVQSFTWSPTVHSADGTPRVVEWTLSLVEAKP